MGEIVVVTGHLGAGRSTAADVFEDLGWFVIDNLPLALMPRMAEATAATTSGAQYERIVLVVGVSPELVEVTPAIVRLRESGAVVRTLFLEANVETLVRRYKETRRRHPFSTGSLNEAVVREQQALEELRGRPTWSSTPPT